MIHRALRRLLEDRWSSWRARTAKEAWQKGAVAIQVALAIVAVIVFVSLGSEVVLLRFIARHMQSAADAGALAAETARIICEEQALNCSDTAWQDEAYAQASSAGFVNQAADGTSVQPNLYLYQTPNDAVEVVITQPRTLTLAKLVYGGDFPISVRAVAIRSGREFGDCVLALDPTASGAFTMVGNSVANFTKCDVTVDSNSSSALQVNGGATLTAEYVDIVGGYNKAGGSVINGAITTGAKLLPDPYQSRQIPSVGPCNPLSLDKDGKPQGYAPAVSGPMVPGTYCGGFSLNAGVAMTMAAGTYIFDGGNSFTINGGSLTGTGVTIVLTCSTLHNGVCNSHSYPTVNITGNPTINLTAPTSGPLAHLAFFQDPRASNATNTFTGGQNQAITGALYFPSQNVTFTGGSAAAHCTRIVALTVSFRGTSDLNLDCSDSGVEKFGGHAVLVK